MRLKSVVDGQQVEIPVPCSIRTVGTQKDSTTREWKDRGKRGRGMEGKPAIQPEGVKRSEKGVAKCVNPAAKKSRYCVQHARTVNRHRWKRRES